MPSNVSCDVNDFYDTFMEMVYANYAENEDALRHDVHDVAKHAEAELHGATGPWSQTKDDPKTGRPAYFFERGWKTYDHRPSEGHVESVVANKNAPSLTHLVEKPHRLFVHGRDTGRMTKGHPIIKTAYENAARYFDQIARVV